VTLTVERYSGDGASWDAFGRTRQGWTHYHSYGWKPVIEQTMGHAYIPLAARNAADGELAGILPVVRVRTRLFGRYIISMPFLNYGGPLGGDEAVRELAQFAAAMADRERARLLELRSAVELPVDLPVSHRKITVVLPLAPGGDVEAAWKALGTKLRAQVKRPQKEGVVVRFGREQVDPFFEVFARHMRDLGTPTLPRAFFRAIAEQFGEEAWFGCAYLGDRPIAAGAGFRWGDEFEMTWASALTEHNRIAPNMALYWAFIERAVRDGVRRFNFGRCTPGGGTHRFKRQWGALDEPLWWYQHVPGGGVAATPSPDDSAYSWGPRIWKKLPLPLATALGPRIVRGIP
jgi:FemAB-related protein (PEP-CTERM system-associated)